MKRKIMHNSPYISINLVNSIELQKNALASIGLHLEDNNTITKTKKFSKTLVSCNNKTFVVNSIPVDHKSMVLNLTSPQPNCSSYMIKNHITDTLSSKIDGLISYLIKFTGNSYSHSENTQELNQLVFELQKINNSSAENIIPEKTLEKFSKILNIIRNLSSQDIFVRIDVNIEDVRIDDKEIISSYNKIYNPKNEKVVYLHRDLLATVSFPLYDLLKRTSNNKLFGIDLEEIEIEIFKVFYQFIFKDIDINNMYRFPKKMLWKDKKYNVDKLILIDHTLPARPLLLLKAFIKIANKVDFFLDKLSFMDKSIKKEMFNLTITEEMLNQFEKDNPFSIDRDSSSNLINELHRKKPTDIESLNKNLNDMSMRESQISVAINKTSTNDSGTRKKKNSYRGRGRSFLSMQSSFMSLPSFSAGSVTLDPTDESFDKLIPPEGRNKPTYILAAMGYGKSGLMKSLIYSNILRNDSSIVLFDPHGDLALEVAKMIKDEDRLVLIDPFLKIGMTPVTNPLYLENPDEETIAIMVQELLSAFELGLGIEWTINMTAVFVPCLSTLLREGNMNITDLQRFMDPDNSTDLLELGKKSPLKGHRDFFTNQFMMEKLEVTKDAIATKLQILLNDPRFTHLTTGKDTVYLEKEINTPGKIIIIKLAKGRMKNISSLYSRLLMATIQGVILRRESLPLHSRIQTHLYLDEFQGYTGLTIEEMLTESRKYGLSVTLAHQTLAHLDKKLKAIILSNTTTKFVGKNSYDELKTMSKEIQIDIKEMENQNIGEFFLKAGSKQAIKIINTDKFLGNKGALNDELWQEHVADQLQRYQRAIVDESLPINDIESHLTLEAKTVQDSTPLLPYVDEF